MNLTEDTVNLPPPPSASPLAENSNTTSHEERSNGKCHNQLCKSGPGAIVGVVTTGAFTLGFYALGLIWAYNKKFKKQKNPDIVASDVIKMPKEFGYKELSVQCTREVAMVRRTIEKEVTAGSTNNLVEWVWGLHREGRLMMVADSRLGNEFDETDMKKVMLIRMACSHPDPMARPAMRAVVQMLVTAAVNLPPERGRDAGEREGNYYFFIFHIK